ncbi:MAG: SdiA-regulated domain-containing protein [Myxococcales bacterium]|nr:SdiA-regulated domain-containing protein [Myxococcales bacterium]
MTNRIAGWNIGAAANRGGTRNLARGAAKFEVAEKTKYPVKEASDVVALPGGRFVIVGDRSDKMVVVDADGKVTKLKLPGLPNGYSQVEGVAYDPVRHHLIVSREEDAQLLRYEWNPDTKESPKLEKTFQLKAEGPANKGIEGLAYLPGELSVTGRPQLLAANEGKPKSLMMFNDSGSGKPQKIHLESQVTSVCRDFSAVAVDPKTGNVFISSDESSTVAQIELKRQGDKVIGRLVQSFPLRDKKDKPLERIEGLTFNEKGDLFVLTENDGALHRLERK